MNLLDACGAGFVLRDLRCRIEHRISQLVDRQLFAPVIRDEDRVGSDRFDDQRGKDTLTPTRNYLDSLAIVYLKFHCGLRMDLDVGLRALFDEETYPPRLVSREVLINNTSTC